MRLVPTYALLLSLSAVLPAVCQQKAFNSDTNPSTTIPTTTAPAVSTDPSTASVDYSALREDLARQHKALEDQLAIQRSIVKKNEDLLKQSQKLDAENKHLAAEQRKLSAHNSELDKKREALKNEQKPTQTAATTN